LFWIIEVIDEHNGFVTAVATFTMAVFTGTLWLVTNKAVRVAQDQFRFDKEALKGSMDLAVAQIELARDEFDAAHRPRIITRSFERATSDGKAAVSFVFVNTGDIETKIAEIGTYVGDNSNPGKIFNIERSAFPKAVRAGDRRSYFIVNDRMMGPIDTYGIRPGLEGDQYLIGFIKYVSSERTFQTGFCRKFNRENGRWVRQTESEYEYVD